MKILSQSSASPFGLLLTLFGHTRWTHTVVAFDDEAYDSAAGHGVRQASLAGRLSAFRWVYQWRVDEITLPNEAAARAFCQQAVKDGAGYDWLALLNFIVPFRARLGLDEKNAYFCSEFAMAVVKAGGGRLLREHGVYVTPDMVTMSPALVEVTPTQSRSFSEVLRSIFGFSS